MPRSEWVSYESIFGWDTKTREKEENCSYRSCCLQENRIHLSSLMLGWYKTTESYSMSENFHRIFLQFPLPDSGKLTCEGLVRKLWATFCLNFEQSRIDGTKVFHSVISCERRENPEFSTQQQQRRCGKFVKGNSTFPQFHRERATHWCEWNLSGAAADVQETELICRIYNLILSTSLFY